MCLRAILRLPGLQVVGVVTQPDRPVGRGKVLKVKPAAGDQIVEISFEKVGVKKTMANFAPLVKITTEE